VTTKSASPQTAQEILPAASSPASADLPAETVRFGLGGASALTKSAGHVIVDSLVAHGVERNQFRARDQQARLTRTRQVDGIAVIGTYKYGKRV